jgi:putative ABC transport system permease protein
MTTLIAWRNLVHDWIRFAVTLIGIVFSVVLMGVQSGLFVSFTNTTAGLVDHSGADLWIVNKGTKGVDLTTNIGERRRFQALSVAGVAKAEPGVINFLHWKRPDGAQENVIVIGTERGSTMGGPWNFVDGDRDVLKQPDAVVIDRLYMEELGVKAVGDIIEISDKHTKIVGLTEGIRTFSQAPYVFMDLNHARAVSGFGENATTYVLIKCASGVGVSEVQAALRARIPDVDIYTNAEFSKITSDHWLYSTGAGASLMTSMFLGFIVGMVIVAQTLYATTMDRLPEYATLRAIGGSSRYLYRIILKQAAIVASVGFAIGIGTNYWIVFLARNSSAAPELPIWLALTICALTYVMCVTAAFISIQKVIKIDPVSVFQ